MGTLIEVMNEAMAVYDPRQDPYASYTLRELAQAMSRLNVEFDGDEDGAWAAWCRLAASFLIRCGADEQDKLMGLLDGCAAMISSHGLPRPEAQGCFRSTTLSLFYQFAVREQNRTSRPRSSN